MHHIDIEVVEMTMDVMKYVIGRITKTDPDIGLAISEEELIEKVGETVNSKGIGGLKAFELFKEVLVKHIVSIDNPRHLAFVPAAPTRASILFDLVTAASSIHGSYWMEGAGGIFCENEAMRWIVSLTGLPKGSFGVFTSGGTAANLSAIVTAREHWRSKSQENIHKRGIILCSSQAHSSVKSMAKIVDAAIVTIATQEALSKEDLCNAFHELSKEDQNCVFAVVANAGSTNSGIIDHMEEVSLFCKQYDLWMHVDAAYGGGALMSDRVRDQFKGIENADSITIDPHKWFFAPYDCGAIIYKKPELAKNAHAQHGSYLEIFNQKGMEGFNPSDYQIQLTRRVRGLPLWFSLAMHGTDRYKLAVDTALDLAKKAEEMINERDYLSMVRPISLSIVLFKRKGWTFDDYRKWTLHNLKNNVALVTPTLYEIDGTMESIARFCFINPETSAKDIAVILDSMN